MTPCGRKMALKSEKFRFFYIMSHISGFNIQNFVPIAQNLVYLSVYVVNAKKKLKKLKTKMALFRETW